ncbi:hypothetical protein DRE_06288 [Drechslerella stenobrocha 248]|uniref:Uncharacterized protein n=1 Tax=Drechslerella stenobrocha 248 TaxID=1043628 RepID=W7HYI7_9PEZI|nr:hypothetical protein DRE_06288 [Drechslerella stenobrocha 248]
MEDWLDYIQHNHFVLEEILDRTSQFEALRGYECALGGTADDIELPAGQVNPNSLAYHIGTVDQAFFQFKAALETIDTLAIEDPDAAKVELSRFGMENRHQAEEILHALGYFAEAAEEWRLGWSEATEALESLPRRDYPTEDIARNVLGLAAYIHGAQGDDGLFDTNVSIDTDAKPGVFEAFFKSLLSDIVRAKGFLEQAEVLSKLYLGQPFTDLIADRDVFAPYRAAIIADTYPDHLYDMTLVFAKMWAFAQCWAIQINALLQLAAALSPLPQPVGSPTWGKVIEEGEGGPLYFVSDESQSPNSPWSSE